MSKQIVFSGTRATGRLHLGNYLGAVKGYIELSQIKDDQGNDKYDCFYMAMDLHAITTPYEHEILGDRTRSIIMDYLAAGLDPKKATITAQSLVPEHTYLSLLFASVVTVARMQHLPTFKEKAKQYPDNVNMALLNYPILMASDILVYRAGLVPVGVDQEPHLEVAREIARKMNSRYFNGDEFLPEPQRFATKGEYIPSLTGGGKMSKSVEGSYINLTDSFKSIRKKVAAIPTDNGRGEIIKDESHKLGVKYISESGKESEGVRSLLTFVELFMGQDVRKQAETDYIGQGLRYGDLKQELALVISKELEPIREKRLKLENDIDYVDQVIFEGAKRARKIAGENLDIIKKRMGLISKK